MYVAISLHTKVGAYCGQGREGKKNTWEKLALGSRECLEKPEWMSSPKHYAQLDHATHAGSLSPHAPWTPSVSGPLAPYPRMASTSCRTRRPRALYASPFFGLRSALDPRPHPRTRPPSLLSSFGDTTTRTPPSSSEPSLLSFITPLRSLEQRVRHGRLYLHSVNRQRIPSCRLHFRCAAPHLRSPL